MLFIGWNLFSLPLYLRWGQPPAAVGGFAAFMVACFALLLVWAGRLPERARSRLMATGFVALTLLDVSTVCLWYVRGVVQESSEVTDAALGRRIGSSDPEVYGLANMFVLRATQALTDSGVEIDRLPAMGSYCTAHSYDGSPTSEDVGLAFGPGRSLALSGELRSEPSLADFFAAPRWAPCVVRQKVQRSYNSALVSGTSAQPSLLFVRDAWSSGWQATVNGSATRIFPAFGAFKTVVVPAGAFEVRLHFSPPWVGLALLASYSLLLAVGLFTLRVR